jgi:hypothetical protein
VKSLQHRLSNSFCRTLTSAVLAALAASLLPICAFAQNPVPQIVGPVHPMSVAPGGGDFTLSVYGANFVPGAVVNWNYQPRATTYVSGHELQALILSADIAKNTAGYISVTNPAPGGGSSSASWAQVEVHEPISTIVLGPPQYHYFGFFQLQAADFTHSGILDLLGEYYGLGLELGKGNGTFRPTSKVDRTNFAPWQFGYGDFNGDGNIDVASFSYLGSLNITLPTHLNILLGDGKGIFSRAPSIYSPYGADFDWLQVGDFNQDGKLDLVTGGLYALSTYLGNGDGTFRHLVRYNYPSYGLREMVAGDFNGDGKLDLIFLQANGNSTGGNLAFWFLEGNGDGTFKTPKKVGFVANVENLCGAGGAHLQLSDFNGDGKLDLAFCTPGQIGVMLGNGDGTFRPPNFYTADSTDQGLFAFGIGDINSDGKPDLIVSEYSNFNSIFAVFLGNGDGTFQAPQTLASGIQDGELGILVGDFNADGMLDVTFQNGGGMNVFLQQ